MEIDLPETSIVASSVQSSSAVATADRKTSKLARSARKSAKTKSAPTSELSPRRLRKTPARVKSNTSTPALSRESSPVKEVLSQKSVDILPLETPVPVVRSKSASTASLRRTNLPEKTIVEKEETPARTMRSTRSTKSKKAEPSDAVWKKANTYGARLHPELAEEPVAVTHSTPSLRKQVASKAIKKDLGLESDISVTESGSKSTVERPLTRQRRKNLETGS